MLSDYIAVIDVETTGLFPKRHDRIVEIGIVVMSSEGEIQFEYETLINPNRDLGATGIHQIQALDILQAPVFEDVAGDIAAILSKIPVIAGHNISFDSRFLVHEYERVGVKLPEIPLLCTCRLFGRGSLQACCRELGISFEGMPHRALSDARATAQLVASLCCEDPSILNQYRRNDVGWPEIQARNTPCYCREHAKVAQDAHPRFLQRIAARIHHETDAKTPDILAYMALIDRVLEDRTIDQNEEEALVEAATAWHLSQEQLSNAHSHYLNNLAVAALADGIISDAERRDLHRVAQLLGHDCNTLDLLLERAACQLERVNRSIQSSKNSDSSVSGQSVCFTGELQATIGGHTITRDVAEALAMKSGLNVVSNVTKKLDLLVVADPNTQSGKAKKARQYGTRILADAVFWRMIGVDVD
ncbi:hypothetical protein GC163_19415 [bacterium]|nr:hypothetical protein [bacterium]